jgi:hypothetical protein
MPDFYHRASYWPAMHCNRLVSDSVYCRGLRLTCPVGMDDQLTANGDTTIVCSFMFSTKCCLTVWGGQGGATQAPMTSFVSRRNLNDVALRFPSCPSLSPISFCRARLESRLRRPSSPLSATTIILERTYPKTSKVQVWSSDS